MKKTLIYVFSIFLILSLSSCGGSSGDNGEKSSGESTDVPSSPVDVNKSNAMAVYAHYMPWFVSPESSGVWNHWTMSANALTSNNLASHYTPLTGAYSSTDADILDYQCLMMKYSGIDGVIIDWCGSADKNDYPTIEKGTAAMVNATRKAGLKFAICYDEQTALNAGTYPDVNDAVTQGRLDMIYLQNNYISKSNYLTETGSPVVLIFGPTCVTGVSGWATILSPLKNALVAALNPSAMNDGSQKNAPGTFLWVNPNPDYSSASSWTPYFGGAMPGFWDVYKEHGGTSYTTYDREDGALFTRQLNVARDAGLKYLQISTWNDYGEGTTIEPTSEYQYKYLTLLQQFTGVSYNQENLELIYKWYTLKKKYAGNTAKTTVLENAYKYFVALQTDKAKDLIDAL
jgi:hypothetical protein|nr:hypothetical protein [Prevotella sp. UBA4952]